MNKSSFVAVAVSAAAVLGASAVRVHSQGPPAPTIQHVVDAPTTPAALTPAKAHASPKKAAPARLSAAQAYKANCTRCHSELPKLEPRAMTTVLMHMRVRANMPKDEARAILEYLTR